MASFVLIIDLLANPKTKRFGYSNSLFVHLDLCEKGCCRRLPSIVAIRVCIKVLLFEIVVEHRKIGDKLAKLGIGKSTEKSYAVPKNVKSSKSCLQKNVIRMKIVKRQVLIQDRSLPLKNPSTMHTPHEFHNRHPFGSPDWQTC